MQIYDLGNAGFISAGKAQHLTTPPQSDQPAVRRRVQQMAKACFRTKRIISHVAQGCGSSQIGGMMADAQSLVNKSLNSREVFWHAPLHILFHCAKCDGVGKMSAIYKPAGPALDPTRRLHRLLTDTSI